MVVAVVEIELALSQIRFDIPAAHIIVHRHARVPLRQFIQRAIATHAIGAMFGNEKVPRHIQRCGFPWRQRFGQIDTRDRFLRTRCHGHALWRTRRTQQLVQLVEHISAFKSARPKPRFLRKNERVERIAPERVLLGL